MRSLPARLPPLQSENVNGKLSKMGFFSIFLFTFTINCVTTGARTMPIEYTRLGMSVTTQGGSGRQFVTGP